MVRSIICMRPATDCLADVYLDRSGHSPNGSLPNSAEIASRYCRLEEDSAQKDAHHPDPHPNGNQVANTTHTWTGNLLKLNVLNGAQSRNRTSDTRIFNPLLYQLSYLGTDLPDWFQKCGRDTGRRWGCPEGIRVSMWLWIRFAVVVIVRLAHIGRFGRDAVAFVQPAP